MGKNRFMRQSLAVLLSLSLGLSPCAPGSFAAFADIKELPCEADINTEEDRTDSGKSLSTATISDAAVKAATPSEAELYDEDGFLMDGIILNDGFPVASESNARKLEEHQVRFGEICTVGFTLDTPVTPEEDIAVSGKMEGNICYVSDRLEFTLLMEDYEELYSAAAERADGKEIILTDEERKTLKEYEQRFDALSLDEEITGAILLEEADDGESDSDDILDEEKSAGKWDIDFAKETEKELKVYTYIEADGVRYYPAFTGRFSDEGSDGEKLLLSDITYEIFDENKIEEAEELENEDAAEEDAAEEDAEEKEAREQSSEPVEGFKVMRADHRFYGLLPEDEDDEYRFTIRVNYDGFIERRYSGFKEERNVEGYVVSISAEAGVFPTGTTVSIKPVTSIDNKNIEELLQKQNEEETIAQVMSFDISFFYAGKEVQPEDGKVSVSIQLADSMVKEMKEADRAEVAVYHIENAEKLEEVESSISNDNKVEYEAESFSVYSVVLLTGKLLNAASQSHYVEIVNNTFNVKSLDKNAEKIVVEALSHFDVGYVSGGDGPGGYDCIGLVRKAYSKIGINLPRAGTGSGAPTWAEQGLVLNVEKDDLYPGDIICWYKNRPGGGQPDHVAIYTGEIKLTDGSSYTIANNHETYYVDSEGYLISGGRRVNAVNAQNSTKGIRFLEYEHQWNYQWTEIWRAPAVSQGYTSECEHYPSYCIVKSNFNNLAIWSQPCKSADVCDTEVIGNIPLKDTNITATEILKNTVGEYWYKCNYNGIEGYILCDYADYHPSKTVDLVCASLTYSGKAFPSELPIGQSYPVDWVIKSNHLAMQMVSGEIIRKSDNAKLFSETQYGSYNTYLLNDSAIDNALKFGSLEVGDYTLRIFVTAMGYFYDRDYDRKVMTKIWTHDVINFDFSIVSGNSPKPFIVVVPDSYIDLTNYTYPSGTLPTGLGYSFEGTITSTYPLAKVHGEIKNTDSGVVRFQYNSAPQTTTYDIKRGGLDAALKVGQLEVGRYIYLVSATDSEGYSRTLIEAPFTMQSVAAPQVSITEYFDCDLQIDCINGQTVNLYNNPLDSTRVTYFSKGQTAFSTYGAKASDGSIWYRIKAAHNGSEKDFWIKYDSSKMTVTNLAQPRLSLGFSSVTLTAGYEKTAQAYFSGNGIQRITVGTGDNNICEAFWDNVDWNGGTGHLKIQGYSAGRTTVTVNIYDENQNVLDSKTAEVVVNANPLRISASQNNVALVLGESELSTVTITKSGYHRNAWDLRFDIDNENVTAEWGAYTSDSVALEIRPQYIGNSAVTVTAVDRETQAELARLVIQAQVTGKNVSVSFNANGGSVSSDNKTVQYGNTYGTLPQAQRYGYIFRGWYTAASGGVQKLSSSKVETTENHTLYAHWIPKNVTVHYDYNDGSNITETYTVSFGGEYGNGSYLPVPVSENENAFFAGWFTEKNGGNKIKNSTIVSTESEHTLYARWRALPEGSEFIWGDINFDRAVNEEDCSLYKSYLVGQISFSYAQKFAADLNGDGKLKASDLSQIQKFLNGEQDSFPVEEKYIAAGKLNEDLIWCIDNDGTLLIQGEGDIPDSYQNDNPPWSSHKNAILSLKIGEGITKIGEYTFAGLNNISSIEYPQSLVSIGNDAFRDCTSIKQIVIPDTVQSVGSRAFSGCTEAETITLGNSLRSLGTEVFNGCPATYVEIPGSLSDFTYDFSKGKGAFSGSSIETASFAVPITTVPVFAFAGSGALKQVNLPDSITSVSNFAFYDSAVDRVFYAGSSEMWDQVIIGYSNWGLYSADIYCSSYRVVYNANGGAGAPGEQTKTHDQNLTISAAQPVRPGYTFLGWAESSMATSAQYQPGGTFSKNKDTILYAVWKEIAVTGISLNKSAITLYQNEEEVLTALIKPADALNKDVIWISSDTSVATVNMGKVTAVSGGTAAITVKTVDGGYTAVCEVTVRQRPTGVSLNKTSTSLNAGESETLYATVTPANAYNRTVSWSSSNSVVATVTSGGVVKGVSAGTATITVKTADGGYTAQCLVTVKQPVTGVSLNKNSTTMVVGSTESLSATVDPANATNKGISWSSSDVSIAAVDQNGTVTAVKAGSARITVITADGNKTAYCDVTVKPKDLKEAFIRRLYETCLDREADPDGLEYWKNRINSGSIKGIALAGSFVFSSEFTSMNYCNRHFVEQIYPALMGREADDGGLDFWAGKLDAGMTREAMLNSFTTTNEYKTLCTEAGIELGPKIRISEYGTLPYGPCAVCGEETTVVQFAKRMYTECLKREAEAEGLAFWSKGLYEHRMTGKSILNFFFLSSEIKNKNLTNREYVYRIYKVMLDREPDTDGLNYWVGRLDSGSSPAAVIAGFIDSQEFTKICNDYGIIRK